MSVFIYIDIRGVTIVLFHFLNMKFYNVIFIVLHIWIILFLDFFRLYIFDDVIFVISTYFNEIMIFYPKYIYMYIYTRAHTHKICFIVSKTLAI